MRFPTVSFQWFVLGLFLFSCMIVAANGNFFTNFLNPELSHAPRFSQPELYVVTDRVGLSASIGQVACFGDLNNDKYTDVFVLANSSTLVVYLWQHSTWSFELSASYISDSNIISAVAGDFNYDGLLDVLVTGSASKGLNYLHLYLAYNSTVYAATTNVFSLAPIVISTSILDQPLILDANVDLKLDLLAITGGIRTVWVNDGTAAAFTQYNLTSSLPATSPVNSNSFADMDGDCLADLLVVSPDANGLPTLQLYLNNKIPNPLTFSEPTLTLPGQLGMGQLTIADFDGDGTLDLLFPVCTPGKPSNGNPTCSDSTIHVVYNIQMPICGGLFGTTPSSDSEVCRVQSDLCTPDPSFSISSLNATTNQPHHVVTDLGSSGQFAPVGSLPLSIRYGDYNFDGYPDLFVPVVNSNGDYVMQLWQNIPCTDDTCGEAATDNNHRTFQLVDDSTTAALASAVNAYAGAFFDLDEDGTMDMILLLDSSLNGTNPGVKSTAVVFNNIYTDAYFLKTLGLNGLCPAWCEGEEKFPDPKPYGVNFPGGIFKFTVTDISGNPRAAIGAQLTQSSYLPLQTPYLLFGLGRTNNYIDNLFYGVTVQSQTHYAYFICIIPNSQIVAFPYPDGDAALWTLELYINPSEFTLWVIVAILVALLLLLGVIMFFRRREKAEDEAEKRERAHLFSFDAM